MTKKALRKISLQYRTLSSQMLKIDSQEEIGCIQAFYDFITKQKLCFPEQDTLLPVIAKIMSLIK